MLLFIFVSRLDICVNIKAVLMSLKSNFEHDLYEVNSMSRIIAVANQKGGVGKTTCTINLGGALSELGNTVLCIDTDPQGNLSVGLGIDINKLNASLADVLIDPDVRLDDVIVSSSVEGLDVVPSTLELASTEMELQSAIGRERVLLDSFSPDILEKYDYILIDCPPTLGLLTINSLVAAQEVIIPVQTQYYALKGVAALLKVINTIKAKVNPNLQVLGMLPTFYDSRTILAKDMLENLRDLGEHRVFSTLIKTTVKLGEAPTIGKPITHYAGTTSAAQNFRDLAQEVISHA